MAARLGAVAPVRVEELGVAAGAEVGALDLADAGSLQQRHRDRGQIEAATLLLNGRRLKVIKRRVFARKRHTATVNLRGLPKGTFKLKITVLTSEGNAITGTRTYRTCAKKRRSNRPPKL